jgi:ribosomal RNA assembly protein
MRNPELRDQDWERFLPKFEKKTLSKRKKPRDQRQKKPYTPFPPAQPESKVDKQLASGEYFLKPTQQRARRQAEQREKQREHQSKREEKRKKAYQPPKEDVGGKKSGTSGAESVDISKLKSKAKEISGKKKAKTKTK